MAAPFGLQARALAATTGTQLGAILAVAYHVTGRSAPAFCGEATITSDGFVTCDYISADEQFHHGAIICDVADLERNLLGLSKHLKLDSVERTALLATVQAWIAFDHRPVPGLRMINILTN